MTPARSRQVALTLAGVLVALVVLELVLVSHDAPRFPWHRVPGYSGVIGLVGCGVVVLLSRQLARWFLQRSERADD